ncbi:zinc-binding dehydrogenase, partial [Nocardia tengchongensis]|uniref:zinc-binding dehydrogenase n=1 Tax=Nocardia tengchongensis TaxID=2055889 RepID=UPI00367B75D3
GHLSMNRPGPTRPASPPRPGRGGAPPPPAPALDRAATGSLTPLVDRVLPLHQAAHAHRLLEDRAAKGTIILRAG